MHALAEASGAHSPKAWTRAIYAEDIAPIIEEQGRNAGLDEIRGRIAKAKRRTRHRAPETEGHGSSVSARDGF
jgi:hypothetical protein